jgi:serine/threonine-protein kinase
MTRPQRLGKYELVEELGKGAMGIVYKAFDPDIHRTVAIKTVRKELVEDDGHAGTMMARFRNEARAAGRLSHPGIVAVYDYGESSAVAYIAMEFVQGASLRDYFNRGVRFAEPDIASIMVQLLDALHHAHEQGVWHRDIKPANLIVMTSGRIKVADFGIARIDTSQLTLTGIVMGSPGYIAPEQYTGGAVDWRADLFAAGVVMYQLLTGAHAFSGTTEQVAYKICHEDPPRPSDSDPGRGWERYDRVIARALAKEPAKRFATADAFRAAIIAAHGAPVSTTVSVTTMIGEPVVATVSEPSNPLPDSAVPRRAPPSDEPQDDTVVMDAQPTPARGAIRRKWPVAIVAVAVLALAIVAAMLLRGVRDAPTSAKAPAAAKRPASPPINVAHPDAETVVAARTTEPTTTPAPSPEPRPPPRRVEPPRKPAAKDPERKVAAASRPPAPKPASAPPAPSGGFWSDQRLTLRVQSRLQFSRSMWNANHGIVVSARNGVVTLTGTVPAAEDIAEAERLAAAVVGVNAVRNELRVGSGQ